MKVIELLNKLGLEEGVRYLTEELHIIVKDYGNFMMLNYDQINSQKHHEIVKECRSLILDKKDGFKPIARALDRFFNYNEDPNSKMFDITKSICYEKIDGSLILLYFDRYTKKWNWSTRKMGFGEGETKLGRTFNQVIMDLMGEKGFNELIRTLRESQTYMFELVSPETRVVKSYGETKLYYLGTRNLLIDMEFLPVDPDRDEEIMKVFDFNYSLIYSTWNNIPSLKGKIEVPKIYRFNNFEEIAKNLNELPEMEEGYVCTTLKDPKNVWRLKVKNPSYLAIAHMRENGQISEKRIATLVFSNDEEEYLSRFEEDRPYFLPFIDAREKLKVDIKKQWEESCHIEDQKEFALKVKDSPIAFILFQRKKGKTIESILTDMLLPQPKDDKILQLLKKYFT